MWWKTWKSGSGGLAAGFRGGVQGASKNPGPLSMSLVGTVTAREIGPETKGGCLARDKGVKINNEARIVALIVAVHDL